MNSRILFGSFVPVDSVLHRLDPRLKLVTCFWYVVIIFFAKGPLTYLLLVAMLGAMIGLSKVPLKMYWAGLKPLLWVIGLTIAIQVLFSSGGHVYWHWGLMAITSGGINQALVILARFILIVLASTVLTATTPPLRLADAIESLMKPLKKIKVPVNQIAMMISIALRFIPTIMDEVNTIVKAQQARGVDFTSGSVYTRVKRNHGAPVCRGLPASRGSGGGHGGPRLRSRSGADPLPSINLAAPRQHCAGGGGDSVSALLCCPDFALRKDGSCAPL